MAARSFIGIMVICVSTSVSLRNASGDCDQAAARPNTPEYENNVIADGRLQAKECHGAA